MAGESYLVDIGLEVADKNASKNADAVAKSLHGVNQQMMAGVVSSRGLGDMLGVFAKGARGASMAAASVGGPVGWMIAGLTTVGSLGLDVAAKIGNVLVGAFKKLMQIVGSIIGKFAELIGRMGRFAKVAALIGAVIGEEFTRRAIKSFADYEQAIVNTISVTGLLGEEAQKAGRDMMSFITALSRTSAKTPTEIAEGAYALASAGLDVAQMMKALKPTIALAEATMAETANTSKLLVSAISGFELPWSQATRVSNAFAAAISGSQLTMEKLGSSFPIVASTAQGFGLSIERTTSALAALANRGMEGSMMGTNLRTVFARLVKTSADAEAILNKYGLTQADVNPEVVGFHTALSRLNDAQMTQTDLLNLFMQRAANAARILMRNVGFMKKFEDAITGTNRAFAMQKMQLDTLMGIWNIFRSTFEALEHNLVEGMQPALKWFGRTMEEIVHNIKETGVLRQWGKIMGDALVNMTKRAIAFVEGVDWAGWFTRIKTFAERMWPRFRAMGVAAFEGIAEAVTTYGPPVIEWFSRLPHHIEVVRHWLLVNIPKAIVTMTKFFTLAGEAIVMALMVAMPILLEVERGFVAIGLAVTSAATAVAALAWAQGLLSTDMLKGIASLPGILVKGHMALGGATRGVLEQGPRAIETLGDIRRGTAAWGQAGGNIDIKVGGDVAIMKALKENPAQWSEFLRAIERGMLAIRRAPGLT